MLIKLVLSLVTINILMKTTSTQFYSNQYYQNMPQQYYPQQQEDYDESMEYGRRRGRTMYGSSGGKLPTGDYDDEESDECKCSCNRCKEPNRPSCCSEVCNSCQAATNRQQGSFVFIPYPYPLIFPSFVRNESKSDTSAATTTSTTTRPSTTDSKKKDTNPNDEPLQKEGSSENFEKSHNLQNQRKTGFESINDFGIRSPQNLKPERRYMLTTMRKTKPAWQPKYGIVPIPDKLAEKLMSQLREIRDFPKKY